MAGNPRNGRPYRRLVAAVKAQGDPCARCGHNIDPTLDARHPMSFTLDHIVPVSIRPELLLDPANARAMHRRCNSQRGNRVGPQPLKTTRRW